VTTTEKLKHLSPALAITAAAAGIGGLLPPALGMVGMATPLFPLGSGLFFLVILGGPLLLLASGLHVLATRLSKRWFLGAFTALLVIVGLALFWKLPRHGLLLDWIAMSLVIVFIAAALRHSWLWAVVGGVWTGVLLGLASVQTAVEFLSPAYRGTPGWWWPLWLLGCILALATGIVAFIRRNEAH
jgi:hypothetical protein